MLVGSILNRRIARIVSRFLALGAGTLLLASCAGDGSFLDENGEPARPPEIAVDRERADVSLLVGSTRTLQITLTNVGGLPLILDGATVSDDSFLSVQLPESTLETGESAQLAVMVTAGTVPGLLEGTVTVASNDPERRSVSVTIVADVTEVLSPEIDVSPLVLTLALAEDRMETRSFVIRNLGSAPLQVTSIFSAASFLTLLPGSATIAAGDSAVVNVDVDAAALVAGMFNSSVVISSDDADEALVGVDVNVTVTPARLSTIQGTIFTPKCAIGGCHDDASMTVGLSVQDGSTYGLTVGVPAAENSSLSRIEPFKPDSSYLYLKIVEDPSGRILDRMPLTGPPFLSDAEIAAVAEWILQGAQDN
ncbi:MAG: hypothetical protein DHS20C21_22980 [Gemmatimonadota bacterium]|nr:MAG: hypothetical protein DHS20C21_22980 [Gemmatimonadota bacterium]